MKTNHDIKCPNCQTLFPIDQNGYSSIVEQVTTQEFKQRVEDETAKTINNEISKALQPLKAENLKLKSQIENSDELSAKATELAVSEALKPLESENLNLRSQIENSDELSAKATELAVSEALKPLEATNLNLKSQLKKETETKSKEIELAVSEALKPVEAENLKLKGQIQNSEVQKKLDEKIIKNDHSIVIRHYEERIDQLEKHKSRNSSFYIGESLENFIDDQFNLARGDGYRNAYFEKDNKLVNGQKGDRIFKDFDDDGNEFISIMIEIKNENDKSRSKSKNEKYFKKLDQDRNNKNLEVAMLVSNLEPESDFYNRGIVEIVKDGYEKMYVVRPQCFMTALSLIRNMAKNNISLKKELAIAKSQNIEVEVFDSNVKTFKKEFLDYISKFGVNFDDAIKNIEEIIKKLVSTKDFLINAKKHLMNANKSIQGFSIFEMAKNSPSVQKRFDLLNTKEKENAI